MKITIYQNREVYKEESKIGNDSENKVETLEFEFPEEYEDFTKYIEFQIKGEKYVDLIEDNKYVITREVAKYGKIKTQVVLKKNTENDVMIFKSDVFTLTVSNSINATENLIYTVGVDLIEKIVTKNNEQDFRLDTLEADNTTNKEIISNLQNDNTTNKTNIKSLQNDNEVNKTDISNIKQEQTTQNTNIQELQTDNTSNKAKILDLEAKNTEQDTNIQKNTDDIEQLKEKDTAQDSLIEKLQAENTKLKKEINSMQIPGEATGNPIHLTDSSNLPCEIAVVGNSEQETRSGKNKLQLYFSDKTTSGVTITKNEDDSITLIGTATANINFLNLGKFLYEVAKGTFKGCLTYKSGSMKDGSAGLFFSSSKTSGTNKGGTTLEAKNKSFDLSSTVTKDTNIYPYIYINSGTTFDNFTFYFQVVNSDTNDFDYEQYGAMPSPDYPSPVETVGQNGSVEIEVCNKNYFDNTEINLNIVGIDSHFLKNKIILNGTSTSNSDIYGFGKDIKLKKGTYTFSYKCENKPANNSCQIIFKNKQKEAIATLNGWYDTTKVVKTFEEDVVISKDKSYFYTNQNITYQNTTYIVQIEAGAVATEPVEHQSYTKVLPIQKEFVKIGDVEDAFIKQDGKWYEQHNIGYNRLTNSMNWATDQTYGDKIRFYASALTSSCKSSNKGYSNYFLVQSENTSQTGNDGISIYANSTSAYVWVSTTVASTVDEWKTFLSENNVLIYYVLTTPKLIECTTEQEEILNSFHTYKGITNISADGIGTLKVNYKKDLETIINNLSATSVAE